MKSREQVIKDGLTKTIMAIQDLRKQFCAGTIKKMVRISGTLSLEINDIRDDTIDSPYYGQTCYYEIYAIKNGVAVDVMTIDTYRIMSDDIYYLLNCYV